MAPPPVAVTAGICKTLSPSCKYLDWRAHPGMGVALDRVCIDQRDHLLDSAVVAELQQKYHHLGITIEFK
jgi:hypothetical protein